MSETHSRNPKVPVHTARVPPATEFFNITINGSTISATGGGYAAPGIGPGLGGRLEELSLSENISLTVGSGSSGGCGIQANSTVTLAKATLTARTSAMRLFDVAPSIIGPLDLSIVYTSEFTGAEVLSGCAAIEIGNLTFPLSAVWEIRFLSSDSAHSSRSLQFNSATDKRLLISVDANQTYTGNAVSDGWSGVLASPDGNLTALHVTSSPAFWSNIVVQLLATPCQTPHSTGTSSDLFTSSGPDYVRGGRYFIIWAGFFMYLLLFADL
jgi:hypothetical protein